MNERLGLVKAVSMVGLAGLRFTSRQSWALRFITFSLVWTVSGQVELLLHLQSFGQQVGFQTSMKSWYDVFQYSLERLVGQH
jgi:hypothetical protein